MDIEKALMLAGKTGCGHILGGGGTAYGDIGIAAVFRAEEGVGGVDFIGEEVIYYKGEPVWAMNYYGRILEPGMISAAEAGQIIKQSLTEMYKEGRFLGGFLHDTGNGVYHDTSEGDVTSFTGKEWITRQGAIVYDLVYHGGLIK